MLVVLLLDESEDSLGSEGADSKGLSGVALQPWVVDDLPLNSQRRQDPIGQNQIQVVKNQRTDKNSRINVSNAPDVVVHDGELSQRLEDVGG